MNWLTVIWSMSASACLTVALINLVIWLKDRRSYVYLLFAAAAMAMAAIATGELQMMLVQAPQQFGWWMRLIQVPIFFAVVSIVWFLRFYFQAGRLWLAWSVCAIRLLALVLNFVFSPNLNYREINSLRQVNLLGLGTASVPVGIVNPWSKVGELGSLFLLAFVIDVSISLWRKGDRAARRRAIIVGGSMVVFVLAGAGHVALIHAGFITLPYMVSLAFLFPIAAMSYELGSDVVRSAQLARELNASQNELRQSEQRMEQTAAAAKVGVWRWDVASDDLWMSEIGRGLLGLTIHEPLNLDSILQILHPDDRKAVLRSAANSINGDGEYECEFRVPLQDGGLRWIVGRGRVEFNGQNKPKLIRGISLDDTERKQAEERLRVVIEAAPYAMIVVNSKGAITLVNAQTELVFGYSRRELIDRPIETLIPERFTSDYREYRRDYLSNPEAREMGMGRELFGRRKDGSEVSVEIRLNPTQTSEGDFILASVVDTTERKKAEREQIQQRNELAHLARVAMLGELSGSLAHELNQPLTAILSNAQAALEFLTQDSTDLNEVRGILQDIVHEDRRAREVIRRLRLLFRKGEVQYEPLDLNELVLEVLDLMNSDLINHGVTTQIELAAALPSVNGDRVQLQQVLINLILNASDAMTENEYGDRRLCVTTRLDENENVIMSVADAGCGISSEEMGRIFEPFHTTKTKGMGLGLSICRTVITAHAGNLWATNNRDRGACFHISLSPVFSPVLSGAT